MRVRLFWLCVGAVPNLDMVEGVDNEKVKAFEHLSAVDFSEVRFIFFEVCCLQIANHLDRAVSNLGRNPLKVLVQVNTSGEECKWIVLVLIIVLFLLLLTRNLICL